MVLRSWGSNMLVTIDGLWCLSLLLLLLHHSSLGWWCCRRYWCCCGVWKFCGCPQICAWGVADGQVSSQTQCGVLASALRIDSLSLKECAIICLWTLPKTRLVMYVQKVFNLWRSSCCIVVKRHTYNIVCMSSPLVYKSSCTYGEVLEIAFILLHFPKISCFSRFQVSVALF